MVDTVSEVEVQSTDPADIGSSSGS